jgi:hypothetical protein
VKARLGVVAMAAAVLVTLPAQAQRWRTIDASRQLLDTGAVSVRLEYGAGRIDLKPAAKGVLYSYNLKYDTDRSEPVSRFDTASRSLAIGLRSRGLKLSGDDRGAGAMRAELTDKVPMELAVELGAVEGDLQLGGLRLTDFSIKGGAADVTVRFDQPNPERLHTMTIEVGAAEVKLLHAANSGAERVHASVGVGSMDLDLTGALAHDVDITASVAMGGMTLRLSPETGLYLDSSTLLADFDKTGLVKRGDGWYSANFDTAPHHVRVRLKAFFASVTFLRDGR